MGNGRRFEVGNPQAFSRAIALIRRLDARMPMLRDDLRSFLRHAPRLAPENGRADKNGENGRKRQKR
jgi:hypothetical protein